MCRLYPLLLSDLCRLTTPTEVVFGSGVVKIFSTLATAGRRGTAAI
jgi:hypothetical protein